MRLFVFGMGYTAQHLAARLLPQGWAVAGTCRNTDSQAALSRAGIETHVFDGVQPMQDARGILAGTTHILVSTPPDGQGDPAFLHHAGDIAATRDIQWLGYLSTTGVYGDHQGGWVDEDTPATPTSERGHRRDKAEQDWQAMVGQHQVPTHVFRLPGIYGPGRSALDAIRQGRTQRIEKPGQVFCRIHVDDIVSGLMASMAQPRPGRIYNLADDEPAPPQDVTAFAAHLLGLDPAPLTPFHKAELTAMGRSFYAECKRVRNDRMKEELGVALSHPTYREGLRAILSRA
jgi:nucleoside-diphosphate-sugar epimerase